jgi:hypothetical protein
MSVACSICLTAGFCSECAEFYPVSIASVLHSIGLLRVACLTLGRQGCLGRLLNAFLSLPSFLLFFRGGGGEEAFLFSIMLFLQCGTRCRFMRPQQNGNCLNSQCHLSPGWNSTYSGKGGYGGESTTFCSGGKH